MRTHTRTLTTQKVEAALGYSHDSTHDPLSHLCSRAWQLWGMRIGSILLLELLRVPNAMMRHDSWWWWSHVVELRSIHDLTLLLSVHTRWGIVTLRFSTKHTNKKMSASLWTYKITSFVLCAAKWNYFFSKHRICGCTCYANTKARKQLHDLAANTKHARNTYHIRVYETPGIQSMFMLYTPHPLCCVGWRNSWH